ncbi:restriction endonuclease subunit S [Corynebacterium jeikeium]|uniref:restriction endonuclease subunit S n=1 Tax=Corynebacterium jeikeium TaxID=38289 RepID=UPI0011C03425|nr:restriction endonuclease subunit S [Corynebacterium jeikeium]
MIPPILSITQSGIKPKNILQNEGQMARNYDGYQVVNQGDFAMNSMDLLTGWVDQSPFDGLTSPDYRVFRARNLEFINGRYFLYVFQLLYSRHIYYKFGQGVSNMGRWRLPADVFLNFPLPVPPRLEQAEISNYLDEKTAEIDGLIGKLGHQAELLERYRRELIARTVTRGLDPDAPMRDSGIDWAGDMPKTWRTQPFVALFSVEKKINSDLRIRNALQFRNGEIVVKPGWYPEDRKLDETLATYKVVTPGMIVINGLNLNYDFRTKRIGLVTQNGVITSAYITLSANLGIDERFASYLLKSMDSRLLFHGMAEGVRKILSWADIRREKIPVPPLREQTEIADFLEEKSAEIDTTIEGIKRQIELLGKYRKQVINDAVTGKIRVGEVA